MPLTHTLENLVGGSCYPKGHRPRWRRCYSSRRTWPRPYRPSLPRLCCPSASSRPATNSFTIDLSDGLIELFGPNPRNDLTLSLGLFFAPTLTLSAPRLEVSASTEVGLAADARFAFFPYLPSRPFNPEALVKEGICDQCHRAVLTAAFRGDGAIPVDAAVFGVDLDAPTLSGVAFDVPILDACGGSPIEPPSRIQVECRRADRKCCTASLFFCTVRPCIPIDLFHPVPAAAVGELLL